MYKKLAIVLYISLFLFMNLNADRNFVTEREDKRDASAGGTQDTRTWKDREEFIKKSLKEVVDDLRSNESNIRDNLFDCVSDSLSNLFANYPDDLLEGAMDSSTEFKAVLSNKDGQTHDDGSQDLMAVTKKQWFTGQTGGLTDDDDYQNVKCATITIYKNFFDDFLYKKGNRNHTSCLTKGLLLHELIHASCFTNDTDQLGEKIAYGCSKKAFPNCKPLPTKNPDHTSETTGDDDYSDECTEANCKKEKKGKDADYFEHQGRSVHDQPDDNYSVADGVNVMHYIDSNFLIYRNGFSQHMENLLGGIYLEGTESVDKLIKAAPVLVIPTGGLFGRVNDSSLKQMLNQYVTQGGTIICFSQQYSEDFDVLPVPQDESISGYGWRQDQSCYHGSVYFKGMHPVLSSSTGELDWWGRCLTV